MKSARQHHMGPDPTNLFRADGVLAGILLLCGVMTPVLGAPVVLPPNATPNVKAVAAALQGLCDRLTTPNRESTAAQLDLLQRCAFFEDPQASPTALASGYAAIVGQQVNALGPQAKKFASLQQDNLAARMSDLRHGSTGMSLSGLELRGDDNRLLVANNPNIVDYLPADSSGSGSLPSWWDNRLGLFVNGSVKVGSKRQSKNSFAFGIKDTSITAGADYRVTDWFVLGASYASGRTRTLFANDLGRLDLKANGGSLFALIYERSFYVDVIAGYGGTSLNTDRNLDYVESGGTLINQQATGSSHIQDMWAGVSAGDELTWGNFVVTPEVSLNFHEIRLRGFTESLSGPSAPGAGLALSYGDAVVPSTQGRLNLHVGYTWSTPWGVIVPQIHGSFIREFRNRADTFAARFAADPDNTDTPLYIKTDAPEGHYFANGGGFTAQFEHGIAAFFDFEQLRTLKTIKSREFSFGVRYEFRGR